MPYNFRHTDVLLLIVTKMVLSIFLVILFIYMEYAKSRITL